ncbi:hypothetical protein [Nocardioides rubriscoriae]|uniref:hypothetical protein n=1 Tax=Nocardioides rubriscoriae TaxID=642762 RepID=UPI0011DF33FC|nr:hypothetical protein [Nocardioides rubriscoriae]
MRFSIEDGELTSLFKVDGRLAPDQLIAATRVFSPDRVITSANRITHDEYNWVDHRTDAGRHLPRESDRKDEPAEDRRALPERRRG